MTLIHMIGARKGPCVPCVGVLFYPFLSAASIVEKALGIKLGCLNSADEWVGSLYHLLGLCFLSLNNRITLNSFPALKSNLFFPSDLNSQFSFMA